MSSGSLALERITRRFGEHVAVNDVSFEVPAGQLLALIGASGSGKTTTLRITAGYEVPDSGRVLFDGRDITAFPPQKRDFGMVFQHYALFPHMSVEDNVAFGLEARGASKRDRIAKARSALESVGLGNAGPRSIQSLSGGEQQRVALARAFVTTPSLLFADEPTGNLDTNTGQAIIELLFAMNADAGTTLVLVTHDDHLAERCHRTLRLDGGRLVADELR